MTPEQKVELVIIAALKTNAAITIPIYSSSEDFDMEQDGLVVTCKEHTDSMPPSRPTKIARIWQAEVEVELYFTTPSAAAFDNMMAQVDAIMDADAAPAASTALAVTLFPGLINIDRAVSGESNESGVTLRNQMRKYLAVWATS